MRLKLYSYLLAASTVFVPVEAYAGIIEFAFVAFTASLQSAIGVTAASFLIGAAKIAAGALVSSLVSQALAPDAPTPPPQEVQANFALEIPPRYWACGVNRIGGSLTFAEHKNGQLFKQVAHCDAEVIEEIALYLNDVEVQLDEFNFVTTDEFVLDDGAKVIQLIRRPGTINQSANALLMVHFSEYTADHRGAGVSDMLMTVLPLSRDQRVQIYRHRGALGLGEPDMSRVCRFGRVYDPRNDSTRPGGSGSERVDNRATWGPATGNFALAIAAHRVDPERFAMDPADINWENIAEQADYCDEWIIDRYGQQVRRYHGGVLINKNEEANIASENKMLAACDGIRFEDEEGRFGIHVGRYVEPDLILRDEDIFEIASSESDDGETTWTHLYAKYTEPQFAYKATASAVWVNSDTWSEGQPVRSKEVPVYEAQHHNHAVRLLRAVGKRSSSPLRLQVLAGLKAKRARTRRFVRLELQSDATLTGNYEIQTVERSADRLTVPLTLIRIEGDPWNLEEGEEGPRPNFSTAIEVDTSIGNIAPEDMDIIVESVAGASGVARLRAEFPVQRPDWLVEIQHRAVGETAWQNFDVTSDEGYGSSGVVPDGPNEYRWRVVGLSGKTSGYNDPPIVIDVVADMVAPAALTTFSVTGGLGHADISITAPNDEHIRRVAVYRMAEGAAFDPDAETPIATIVAVPSGSYLVLDGDDDVSSIIVNGSFSVDANWTKTTGWSIASGVASRVLQGTSTNLVQGPTTPLQSGQRYRVGYDLKSFSGTGLGFRFIAGSATGAPRTVPGYYLETLTPSSSGSSIFLNAQADTAVSVDDVVIFPETVECAPQGVWDYYAVPLNPSNVAGPASGPATVTII